MPVELDHRNKVLLSLLSTLNSDYKAILSQAFYRQLSELPGLVISTKHEIQDLKGITTSLSRRWRIKASAMTMGHVKVARISILYRGIGTATHVQICLTLKYHRK